MKKAFLILALLCAGLSARGQVVDGVNLAERQEIKYIKVLVADAGKFGKERFLATVDYGQPRGGNQNFSILDEKGERRVWVSDMEVANYFAGLGWRLLSQQRLPLSGSTIMAEHLVFERR